MADAYDICRNTEFLCDIVTKQGAVNMSYIYNSYGVVEMQHENYIVARNWFDKVYEIRQEHLGSGDLNTVGPQLNILLILLYDGKYQEALDRLPLVEELFSKVPDPGDRLLSLIPEVRSTSYMHLGRLNEAWDELQVSIEMTKYRVKLYSQGSG